MNGKTWYAPINRRSSLVIVPGIDDTPLAVELQPAYKSYSGLLDSATFSTTLLPGSAVALYNSESGRFATFSPVDLDLCDRGIGLGINEGVSPIYYLLDTVGGEVVHKFEWQNAGLAAELVSLNGLQSDTGVYFVNVQVYLYPESRNVEFRYGRSNLPNDLSEYNLVALTRNGIAPWIDFGTDGLVPSNVDTSFLMVSDRGEPTMVKTDFFEIFERRALVGRQVLDYPGEGTVYSIQLPQTTSASQPQQSEQSSVGLAPVNTLVSDRLILKETWEGPATWQYALHATDGRAALKGLFEGDFTIDVSALASADYWLVVNNLMNQQTASFRISILH